MRRYAEGTTVTVESSRGEITGILAKHGCDRMAWGTEPEGDTLQFVLGGKSFRFMIERPTARSLHERWKQDGDKSAQTLKYLPSDSQVAAEWRRRWRAHVLLIKAKLEFIEGGDTTLEREFLPYAVMKDGRTVGELIDDGGLPLLASGGEVVPLITVSTGPRNARTDPDTGLRYYTWRGQEYVSVTSVRNLAGMPHKLATWRTTQVIDKAMAEYPMLGTMLRDPNVDPKSVASWLRKAADAKRDAAADLGKKVHDFAARGVSAADAPPEVAPFLLQYRDFMAKSGLRVELTERQVWSPTHGYAGTFDLIGSIGGKPWMIDLKTGSGTYPEHAFQTEAYARADFIGEDDVIDMAATDILRNIPMSNRAVLHLRPDGWSFKQIPGTERTWQAFLSLLDFALWTDDNPTLDSLLGAVREGKA